VFVVLFPFNILFYSIVVGCPEGCLEVHFPDNTFPHVLRQPSSSCEYPNILAMDCVFHADKHWRVYTGDSFGNLTCWTATVIASMCDAYAFFQSLKKSKAMGMIGDLSDAVAGGNLSASYKFTSILDVENTTQIPSQNGCKITCMVMDERRNFLIAGDAVGMLKMFTNTMEELWFSTKHKCAIRSISISTINETFASGDVRFIAINSDKILQIPQAHGRFIIWHLTKKTTLLDIETDSSIPIIGMQFLNPFCPALVTCSLEGKFRVWALHTPLVAPQRAKHDESIGFSKQVEFETAIVGDLFVPDAAIDILYGANHKVIDQNIAGARTLLIQIPESKRCVCILEPHGHRIHCISQLSSNGYFATCGAGSDVLFWSAASIACVKTFKMSVIFHGTDNVFCLPNNSKGWQLPT
jgi:WD40 repeat protein